MSLPKLVDREEDKWVDQQSQEEILPWKKTESAVMHGYNSL